MTRFTNRKGIGFEINQEYEKLIKDRIMEDWSPPIIDPQYKTISVALDVFLTQKDNGSVGFEIEGTTLVFAYSMTCTNI